MDFGLSQDQETLQGYARDVLDKECPPAFVRAMMEHDTAHDLGFSKRVADLGWMGIAIPEVYGGQGMTYVDLAVVVEEMGRALTPGPFFASVCLATPVILEAGTEAQKAALLPWIAAGERNATVAFTEPSGRLDPAGVEVEARKDRDGWVLSGSKSFVLDAHVADTIVVAARTSKRRDSMEGITLFAVDRTAEGVSVTQRDALDMTRRLCDVTLEGVRVGPDAVMGDVDGGWPALQRGLQRATALLCAESVGGAQKVLDLSVDYAKVRVQFGRAIGSFQAVKHRCADMLIDVEMARSGMYYAAWAASDGESELTIATSMAKAFCTEAYTRVAQNGILVHGGIGFTWEHDLHLYLRRARSNEALLGDPVYHRELVAGLAAS